MEQEEEKKEWTLGRMLKWLIGIIVVTGVSCWLAFSGISGVFLNLYWFESLGYEFVYLKNLGIRLTIFLIFLVASLTIFWVIWKRGLAQRLIQSERLDLSDPGDREAHMWLKAAYSIPTVIISLAYSTWVTNWIWFDALRYAHRSNFGVTDPVFHQDLGFYFFELPLIRKVLLAAFVLVIAAIVLLFLINWVLRLEGVYEKLYGDARIFDAADALIAPLKEWNWKIAFSALCFIGAAMAWFKRYSIVYSSKGVVHGAGYVDTHVWLPYWYVLAVILVFLGIGCLIWKGKFWKEWNLGLFNHPVRIGAILGIVALSFLIAATLAQALTVAPSELSKEGEYIDRDISMTRYGFNLDQTAEINYLPDQSLNLSILNSPTMKGIRILDYRAARAALEQKQELRLYYDFEQLDIDRYTINGTKVQVIVAPREMRSSDLSGGAKTWVNQKLVYTHGYGATICPVNEVDLEGMPVLWVKDIPPQSKYPELNITQPRIYYGEQTDDYIITNTREEEFDYPQGENNIYLKDYPGTGGMKIAGGRKWAAALKLDFWKILLSEYLTSNSRLHWVRNVDDRVQKIAPFIYWDRDPYLFLDRNGTTHWMVMGVAASDRMPYSKPGDLGEDKANYVRDSVKAIVDPLDGSVNFYVTNWNPLIKTYDKIYPGLFQDISEMPSGYFAHFKYPEDLFNCQVEKFQTYHMEDRKVFYNKEDEWLRSEERYRGKTRRVESYNVLLSDLPGLGQVTDLMLMTPLTPRNKQNMIAWMSVNQNPERYGELICYLFPKGILQYGPSQVEARIDQNEEISKLMTLWGQKGSEVLRGNLLVIPVQNSLLYVEPIYISSESSAIPELKKVVVVYHDPATEEDRVAIGDSIEEAVTNALVPSEAPDIPEEPKPPGDSEIQEIIDQIRDIMDQLNDLLDQLEETEE